MADNTKISWADATWSPITGCTPISEGCEHCYAKRMANRLRGRFGYPKDDPFRVTFNKDRLTQPDQWRKPRRIFCCSMGDLFHIDVPFKWIDQVFWKIGFDYIHHTFLILTKRPLRMKQYFDRLLTLYGSGWPNVWLGCTVENQARADERIPIFLQIPAAKRFVSIEPMLTDINLRKFFCHSIHCLEMPHANEPMSWVCRGSQCTCPAIDWVIVGGLSLPGGKIQPPKTEWIESIIEQCDEAGVPLFIKPNAQYPIERKEFPQ